MEETDVLQKKNTLSYAAILIFLFIRWNTLQVDKMDQKFIEYQKNYQINSSQRNIRGKIIFCIWFRVVT